METIHVVQSFDRIEPSFRDLKSCVKVHYDASQPGQLDVLACAQGSDIHLGPAREQHPAHAAWHVVQRAKGREKPTMQRKECNSWMECRSTTMQDGSKKRA